MLSNPLHRFSPYHTIPSTTLLSNGHVPTGHMHATGLDTLAQGSHYALQQLQQHVGVHNPHLARPGQQVKHRQNPYGPARAAGAAGPIRRRISRACDQCNQLRTKCDGQHPCAHCIEFGLGCEYIRERKKRGKASRKDLAQQAAAQAAAAAAAAAAQTKSENGENGGQGDDSKTLDGQQNIANEKMMNELAEDAMQRSQRTGSMDSLGDMGSDMGVHQQHLGGHHPGVDPHQHQQHPHHHLDNSAAAAAAALDLNGYGAVHASYDRQAAAAAAMGAHMMGGAPHTPYAQSQATMSSYPELPYALQTQSPTGYSGNANSFRMGTSPLSAYPMAGEPASPPWMTMSSPPPQYHQPPPNAAAAAAAAAHMHAATHGMHAGAGVSASGGHMPSSYNPAQLRYPVLEPLVPHLGNIVPLSLACDLIDLYFASSSSAQMHPMSPYVLGFVFRKRSFLHPTKPRQCQPALLASMLWVAAQTSDAPFLTSVPSARGKICQKLLELTVSLLKPLIHTPSGETSPVDSPVIDGVNLGGLGVALPGSISMDAALATGAGENAGGAFGAAGTLDDVVTYIHLATVVSASEYKGASLRWWNAAWSLARELKLGRELPLNALASPHQQQAQQPHVGQQQHPHHHHHGGDMDAEGDDEDGLMDIGGAMGGGNLQGTAGPVSEEEREERRRIWWLVYIVDRHLALCYNRPLFLLDIECAGLLRPMDDTAWQNGEFRSAANGGGSGEEDANDDGFSTTDPNVLASDLTNESNVNAAAHGQNEASTSRPRGPTFECSGHSIYGYFLPLMTILGEIVDLHHARNHPRFGLGFRASREWDDQVAEITRHLNVYEQSLKAFEQRNLSPAALAASNEEKAAAAAAAADASNAAAEANNGSNGSINVNANNGTPGDAGANANNGSMGAPGPQDVATPSAHSVHSVHSVHQAVAAAAASAAAPAPSPRMTELDIQTRIVAAYGTHVMHVLHILLTGKWDPVNLLDDNDLWISSQGFITATGHAVSAAEAISSILEYDPGLEFMPFFFGIYLLQGSFLLLLIADKLQLEASASVVRACETIIRAHEACVVTLNTEYQRNFSRVMRSALATVRGRVPEDLGEQHLRRRELLALYRWTGDGTGLAL